jgi:hypothetical protein
MGTKFRTMLAPIGLSTGDGRRFASGGITAADVPFAFEWVRSREGGHDGAVSVGAITVKEAIAQEYISAGAVKGLDSKMEAVWATGEFYDGVDRESMPTLAEDVATAMHLISEGTLGPSVDLDSFEGVPVFEGTDEPVSWEAIEAYYEEHGEEPKLELLVTEGRVRAATLVSIPAFAETSRPLELIVETEDQDEAAVQAEALALIASVGTAARPDAGAFALPALAGPTPITWDHTTGRVFGHIATWKTCHVGYSDVCVTAPKDEAGGYAWFNRFPVETEDGTVWAGRITVGGRHAGLSLNASATMAVYDGKTVAADVRAYEDEHGIVVAGVIRPGLTASEIAALNRRKVSGDWRETPGGLSLVEVLFTVEGRQTALTASLGPDPEAQQFGTRPAALRDLDIRGAVRAALAEDREAMAARAELAATIKIDADRERAALAAAMEGEG